jgi:hypothetical protein
LGSRERYWEHHTEQSDWDAAFWTDPGEIPLSEWRGTYWEPLVAWRFYIRKFAAALNIAHFLQKDRPGQHEDWAEVASVQDGKHMGEEFAKREWKPSSEVVEYGRKLAASTIEFQGMCLANAVTRWILDAGVIPWVSWEANRAQLSLALGRPMVPPGDPFSKYEWHQVTLYGLLVTQLAAAVTSAGEFATCGWCGQTYKPDRKPPIGRRHFCSPECQKDAHRAADAEYQRKKRRELT